MKALILKVRKGYSTSCEIYSFAVVQFLKGNVSLVNLLGNKDNSLVLIKFHALQQHMRGCKTILSVTVEIEDFITGELFSTTVALNVNNTSWEDRYSCDCVK